MLQQPSIAPLSSSSSSASSSAIPLSDIKSQGVIMQSALPSAIKKQSEALFTAIEKNKITEVEKLIASGVPLNVENNHRQTPLTLAASAGRLEIVKRLLATPERRATALQATNSGDTALNYAVSKGHLPIVQYLIEQNVSVNENAANGITALMAAAANGHLHIIKYLIKQGADLMKKTPVGDTAPIWAARNGYFPIVKYLVEQKASMADKNKNGYSALDLAMLYDDSRDATKKAAKAELIAFDLESGIDKVKDAGLLALLKKLRNGESFLKYNFAILLRASNPVVTAKALAILIERLQKDPSEWERSSCANALSDLGAKVVSEPTVLTVLIDCLQKDKSGKVRSSCARALKILGEQATEPVVTVLVERLKKDIDTEVLGSCADAIGNLGEQAVAEPVFAALEECLQKSQSHTNMKNSEVDWQKFGLNLIVSSVLTKLRALERSLPYKKLCEPPRTLLASEDSSVTAASPSPSTSSASSPTNPKLDVKSPSTIMQKEGHSVFDFIRNQDDELVTFLKDSQAKFEQQSSVVLPDSSSSISSASSSSQPSSTSSVSASPSTSSPPQFASSSSSQTNIQPQLSVTPKEAKTLLASPAEVKKEQEFTENWEVVWPGDSEDSFDSAASQSSSSSSSSSVTPKPDIKDRKLAAGIIPTPPAVSLSPVAAIPSLQPKTASTIPTKPSDQKQRVSQISGQIEVVEIQADIRQGNVDALLIQLQTGSQAAVSPAVAEYIRHDALSDVLRAKVNPTAEIKGEQQRKLDQLLDALLVDPTVSVTRENADGLTPIDIALQHQDQLPVGLITKLQHKELEENDRQYAELMHFVKEHKFDKPEDQKKQTEMLGLLGTLEQTLQALDHAVKSPVTAAPAATEASSSLSSVDYTPEQLAQINRAREWLKVRLTEAYTKSLAVHYNLLNTHSQDRVGKAVSILSSTLFYFFPIPGLPLAGKLLYEAGKFITSSAVGTGAKKLDRKRQTRRHDNRIDNMATMDQVAQRMMALVGALTQRFQDIFAHLDPESVDVFVDTIVSRLMKRWGEIGEKFEKEGIDRNILAECLIDFDLPLPKNSPHSGLSPEEQFDNLIQNMVMSTLRKVRKADASGYTAGITAGSGMKAGAASFILGDRMVKLNGKKVMVQEVCRDTPPLTWLGDTNEHQQPIYYRCKLPDSVDDHKQDLSLQATTPIIFLTEEECVLRGFEAVAPVNHQLPFPPMRSVPDLQLQRIKELEKLLADAEKRAEAEKARADTLAARLTELEQSKTALSSASPVSAANGFTTPGVDFFALPRSASIAGTPTTPVVEERAPALVASSSTSSAL